MPTSTRKFYKTIIKVTVLSESPFTGERGLRILPIGLIDGPDSGSMEILSNEQIDAVTAAQELQKQGSHPSFFMLDEEGNDMNKDEESDEEEESP